MAQIREMARIVAPRGARGNDLATQAFLVWQTARNRTHQLRGKRDGGHIFHGNLTEVILSLWPEMAPSRNKAKLDRLRSDIYQFLRQSGNAICIDQGGIDHRGVKWLIADAWIAPASTTIVSHIRETRTERRLTPEEAGETRPPAPVTVTQINVASEKETDIVPTKPELSSQSRDTVLEVIEELLNETGGQPITVSEMAHVIEMHPTTVRFAVRKLVLSGQVFERFESTSERRIRFHNRRTYGAMSMLYSNEHPVPRRTKADVITGYTVPGTAVDAIHHGGRIKVVQSALTETPKTVRQISDETDSPSSSVSQALNSLVKNGTAVVERTTAPGTSMSVSRYSLKPAEKDALTPVKTPPSAPLDDLREQLVGLIDRALGGDQTGRVAELEDRLSRITSERDELAERVEALEKVLEPLRELLQ